MRQHPIWNVAVFGLANGGVIAAVRAAAEAGVPPLLSALVQTGGAGLLLLAFMRVRGRDVGRPRLFWRYALIAGLLGLAVPNAIDFNISYRVDPSVAGLLFALPPSLTYLASVLLGLDEADRRRMIGVGLGFAGAMLILLPDVVQSGVGLGWLALGALVPLSLTTGNIYRSVAWPDGAGVLDLASGTLLAASLLLLPVAALGGGFTRWSPTLSGVGLLALEAAVTAVAFVFFFDLQRRGGPVYLSLIGYAVAAAGVLFAALVFGQAPGWSAYAGFAIILASFWFAKPQG